MNDFGTRQLELPAVLAVPRRVSVRRLGPAPAQCEQLLQRLARLPAPLVLESRRYDATLGRYSYLTADPLAYAHVQDDEGWLHLPGTKPLRLGFTDPFALVAATLQSDLEIEGTPRVPFLGGWGGWFGYELGTLLEPVPEAPINDLRLPRLGLGFYDWCLAIDHGEGALYLVIAAESAAGAAEREQWVRAFLAGTPTAVRPLVGLQEPSPTRPLPPESLARATHTPVPEVFSDFTADEYLCAVARALDYIRAGDVYQVNLSQRLLARWPNSPLALYLRLRRRNPAFYGAYCRWGPVAVLSSSPEQFLRVRGRQVETRPIKGTRSRWPYPEADLMARLDLATSPKDRAENVMIVDLLRNDLGRVCEYGSVRVVEPLRIYSFPYVHHLVSTVVGTLREDLTAADLLRAAFPGGSVTGAPKVRAMQIIAELEPTVRGPYCGAIGFVSLDGALETNIAIRTMTWSRGWVQFPVGGGIVADSTCEGEYEETWHKARGMLRALMDTERRSSPAAPTDVSLDCAAESY